jgi:membrane associated rhomboid family serine protease
MILQDIFTGRPTGLLNSRTDFMAGFTSHNNLLPPVVKMLLIANGLMFVLEIAYGEPLITSLALWPLLQPGIAGGAHFQILQLVTYSFLHGSLMHLFLNMYALWLFGSRMENVWGSAAFAVYYFVCVIGAGMVQLLVSMLSGGYYPTVGASGGVFGLLLAFGMRFPDVILMLIFPPVALPAKWFVTLFAGIELLAGVTGTAAGVAHFAHLGGMLFGYLLIRFWQGRA